MRNAFEKHEVVEMPGDLSEAIDAYIDDKFGDEVVDFQIYYNGRGENCVAMALQYGDIVEGGVLLVMPNPGSDADIYKVSGVPESEGPIADFCPQRILDILSPTDNKEAMYWRDRCRHRLLREAGQTAAPPQTHEPEGRWNPRASDEGMGGHDWHATLDAVITIGEPSEPKI